jgi:hypothetical protein
VLEKRIFVDSCFYGPLYIIQVNVYPYIRQVGSMESTKILFSSTDIWVMDYTVTVIVNKFINGTIYAFSSSLSCCSIWAQVNIYLNNIQGAVETFMSSNQTRSFLPTKLSIDVYFSERFSSDSVRVVGDGSVLMSVYRSGRHYLYVFELAQLLFHMGTMSVSSH